MEVGIFMLLKGAKSDNTATNQNKAAELLKTFFSAKSSRKQIIIMKRRELYVETTSSIW